MTALNAPDSAAVAHEFPGTDRVDGLTTTEAYNRRQASHGFTASLILRAEQILAAPIDHNASIAARNGGGPAMTVDIGMLSILAAGGENPVTNLRLLADRVEHAEQRFARARLRADAAVLDHRLEFLDNDDLVRCSCGWDDLGLPAGASRVDAITAHLEDVIGHEGDPL